MLENKKIQLFPELFSHLNWLIIIANFSPKIAFIFDIIIHINQYNMYF